jgi:acetyl esterase/lipase
MNRFYAGIATSTMALLLAAPAVSGQDGPYEVVTDVVSHEDTQDIHVWAPATEGSYPTVYAMHGTGGFGANWDIIGAALAAEGVVVFATDYHSTDAATGRFDRIAADLECGYRYAREITTEYGGDLDQPFVNVGHSLGAELGVSGALNEEVFGPGGTYDTCFTGAERPDAVVAIAGCYYEYDGRQWPFDTAAYGTGDASIVFVAGEDDEVCPSWQSEDAAEAFAAAGFDATYHEVPGATHLTLIGHDLVDGEWLTLADHPAPAEVAKVVLATIDSAAE